MLEQLLEHNGGYFAIISNLELRPWGRLYYNPDNPGHYDSNHAEIISSSPGRLAEVVTEIETFYKGQGLLPRIYINQFSQPPGIADFLAKRGYTIRESTYSVLLWDNLPLQPVHSPGLTVEKVHDHNRAEALQIVSGERSWGTPEIIAKVFAREFAHPAVQYYLVRKDGVPAATGFLFFQGELARVENIRTLPQFRGQGCAAALLRHMQQQFTARGGAGLYLLAGEAVRGLYQKHGFRNLGTIEELIAIAP